MQPGQIGRNPFLAVTIEPTPVLPAYFDYLSDVLHGDPGAVLPAGAPLGPIIFEATTASLGLLAVAFILSVLVGLGLGVRAVRTPGQRRRTGTTRGAGIAPWLTSPPRSGWQCRASTSAAC